MECGRYTTDTDGDGGVTLLVHQAWDIAWAASDTSSLSPMPPTLTSFMMVPTWTPGEVIPDGVYDGRGDSPGYKVDQSFVSFLAIGLPIIVAVLIGSCVSCCVWSCLRKRRARRAAAQPTVAVPRASYEMDSRVGK